MRRFLGEQIMPTIRINHNSDVIALSDFIQKLTDFRVKEYFEKTTNVGTEKVKEVREKISYEISSDLCSAIKNYDTHGPQLFLRNNYTLAQLTRDEVQSTDFEKLYENLLYTSELITWFKKYKRANLEFISDKNQDLIENKVDKSSEPTQSDPAGHTKDHPLSSHINKDEKIRNEQLLRRSAIRSNYDKLTQGQWRGIFNKEKDNGLAQMAKEFSEKKPTYRQRDVENWLIQENYYTCLEIADLSNHQLVPKNEEINHANIANRQW